MMNNIHDLLGDLDWYGSVADMLAAGITNIDNYDVSDTLKELWGDAATAYEEYLNMEEDITTRLAHMDKDV